MFKGRHYTRIENKMTKSRDKIHQLTSKNINWKPKSAISSTKYKWYGKVKLMVMNTIDKRIIITTHNYARANVYPPAQDMMALSWNDEAQKLAENWAISCITGHDNISDRTPKYFKKYGCGQNLAYTSHLGGWDDVINAWDAEKYSYIYGGPQKTFYREGKPYYPTVAHYVQLVWSSSQYVGCAISYCPNDPRGLYFHWACNYCPKGNTPTEMDHPYTAGKSQGCTKCLENGRCETRGSFAGKLYTKCDKTCHNSYARCEEYYRNYKNNKYYKGRFKHHCPREFDDRCREM
ncbi:unnamed protein product [Gordionus sp. m RMFG-2023]